MKNQEGILPKIVISIYRFGNKYYHIYPCRLIWKILDTVINKMIFNTELPAEAKIGVNFIIYHPYGIIINKDAVIGNNVVIRHQVTIGEVNGKVPVLGNDINIGAGAKIIGDIVLGDNITVGANAVVTKSFPGNNILVGIPAKEIVRKE